MMAIWATPILPLRAPGATASSIASCALSASVAMVLTTRSVWMGSGTTPRLDIFSMDWICLPTSRSSRRRNFDSVERSAAASAIFASFRSTDFFSRAACRSSANWSSHWCFRANESIEPAFHAVGSSACIRAAKATKERVSSATPSFRNRLSSAG